MTHPGGRPLKFKSAKQLQNQIDSYFALCCNTDGTLRLTAGGQPLNPPTISGLALHLDTSRETLMNYEQRGEYFDTVKRAKLKIEAFYESRLCYQNAAGPIFALKNFGWTDKQDISHSGGIATANVTLTPEQNQAGLDAIMRYQNKHKEEK